MTSPAADLQRRLLDLFRDELAGHLQVLNAGLVELERSLGSATPPELIAELFRAVHTVKGGAHAVALPDVVAVADVLETRIAHIRDDATALDAEIIDALFTAVDDLAHLYATQVAVASDEAEELSADAAASPSGRPAGHVTSVRVMPERVEELVDRASELSAVAGLLQSSSDQPAASRAVSRVASELRRSVQALRLQPFANLIDGFERALRDLARDSETDARLVVDGADTELDREVAAELRDPLLHLLRNAVAHGIEAPADRRAAGKEACGTVHISAVARGDRIEVVVRDDGRGVNFEALHAAARRAGLDLPDGHLGVAFVPGVSTAGAVTAASGRGVGLDAVRSTIERLGGSVQLTSEPGEGTTVTIHAPLTRSTTRLLAVGLAGGQIVGVPTAQVHRVTRAHPDQLRRIDGRPVVVNDGEVVPLMSLAAALGFESARVPADSAVRVLIVDGSPEPLAAFVVEDILDEREIVLEALPERLRSMDRFIGVTSDHDGSPVLVVNVPACVRRGGRAPENTLVESASSTALPLTILLAEDALTTRALERSILETAGYHVIVAADGAEAWELLQAHGADVVVSDVDMPRMDGLALCRAIRTSSRFREVPVVLVTSLDSESHRRRGLEAGASAYLVKSAFDQRRLLDAVERVR